MIAEKLRIPSESSVVAVPFVVEVNGSEIELALNVHKVVKVCEAANLEALPPKFHPFVATFAMDGLPVPVLDIKAVISNRDDLTPTTHNDPSAYRDKRLIICHYQTITVGILVDRTKKLCQFRSSEVQPCPAALDGRQQGIYNAVIGTDKGFIYFMDIEAILADLGVGNSDISATMPSEQILKGKTILIVEDSPFFQKRTREFFKRHGALTELAQNGQEGLEAVAKRTFDLIFTDIEMPLMNGIQMASILKSKGTKTPILFNSAISNPALIEELKQRDLGDYLVKYEELAILDKLRSIFEDQTKP